jgi:protocatechuate 3,4-dioxygenase beta subunit
MLAACGLLLAGSPVPAADDLARQAVLMGKVVDEAGNPIAGATVAAPGREDARPETTDNDGGFRLMLVAPARGRMMFIELSAWGRDGRIGFLVADPEKPEPVRIVLTPPRQLAVRVLDEDGQPVADAEVEILGVLRRLCDGRTDAQGRWVGRVPAGERVWIVSARKAHVGFDYAHKVRPRGPQEPLTLTLDGARTLRVKAVGRDGKPIAGVKVGPLVIQKPGHPPSGINLSGTSESWPVTGEDGTVTLDWLPGRFERALQIIIRSGDYSTRDAVTYLSADDPADELTITLLPIERLSGRVTHADGRPAAGILVSADGRGPGNRTFYGAARTGADGRYTMSVYSEQAYVIAVTDDRWGAPYRAGVVVRADKSVDGIDFVLGRATRLHGRVMVGKDGRPVPKAEVWLNLGGGRFPEELWVEGRREDRFYSPASMILWDQTDGDGRFEFHIGPGEYELCGPRGPKPVKVKLTVPAADPPAEIVRDIR